MPTENPTMFDQVAEVIERLRLITRWWRLYACRC